MKWSQAVCASILVEGLHPPSVKVASFGTRGSEGSFQEAYRIFGTYAPDDRFRERAAAANEPPSLTGLRGV